MKRNIVITALLFFTLNTVWAQEFRGLDKSPLDIAYLPDNFAHDRKFAPERTLGDNAIAKITYSRPQKKGREVFGGLIKYNELWRLGANEATQIEVYQDIKIGSNTLKKGTYTIFAIPKENEWTILFNSDLDVWGHYSYVEEHDVLRVKASVKNMDKPIEAFSIQFKDLEAGKAMLRFSWDKTVAELPISY
jgi:hypothetical protein